MAFILMSSFFAWHFVNKAWKKSSDSSSRVFFQLCIMMPFRVFFFVFSLSLPAKWYLMAWWIVANESWFAMFFARHRVKTHVAWKSILWYFCCCKRWAVDCERNPLMDPLSAMKKGQQCNGSEARSLNCF